MFSLENLPTEPVALSDLRLEAQPTEDRGVALFDLTLSLRQVPGGILGRGKSRVPHR